jgi:hypothetical protein
VGFDLRWVRGRSRRADHHFNLAGMGVMREILHRTGVLDWKVAPAWDDGLTRREVERILAFRSPRRDRVPAAKLCTNDGWLLTPAECRLLAAALETRGAAAVARLKMTRAARAGWTAAVADFARYCRGAARAGGFRVW